MTNVRRPAVAGMFYPDKPAVLLAMVEQYLGREQADSTIPKAIIAPHAGYIYSGVIAGAAYAYLANGRSRYRRILLLGPAHRVALRGLALSSASFFSTPLGDIPVDRRACQTLEQYEFIETSDKAHHEEHSLEVQLPFLQLILDKFLLIPLVVGDASPGEISQVISTIADNDDTAVVVSSDLSHFLSYGKAQQIDSRTTKAIELLSENISPEQACGAYPLRGLMRYAQEKNLTVRTIGIANSGDTAGPKDSVVGYGAYILS